MSQANSNATYDDIMRTTTDAFGSVYCSYEVCNNCTNTVHAEATDEREYTLLYGARYCTACGVSVCEKCVQSHFDRDEQDYRTAQRLTEIHAEIAQMAREQSDGVVAHAALLRILGDIRTAAIAIHNDMIPPADVEKLAALLKVSA